MSTRIFILERINARLLELRERHKDDKIFYREAARMMEIADPQTLKFCQKHIADMRLNQEEVQ